MERFWAKVERSECWLWTACVDENGYGMFRLDGRTRRAHAVAYERCFGPVPEGLEIDHTCRVRHCVNPAHLEAVTHAENVRRSVPYGSTLTHCKRGHEFDEANTRLYHGVRVCRTCVRDRAREAYRTKHNVPPARHRVKYDTPTTTGSS